MAESAPRSPAWTLPASILAGSAMIAVGLYAGLQRDPPPASPPPPSPSAPPPAYTIVPAIETPGTKSATDAATDFDARIAEQTRLALEEQKRASFLPKCWFPIVADGGLNQSGYVFVVSFDAAGKETGREIRLRKEMSRPDAAECMRALGGKIAIPAPGFPVAAEVEIWFP